MKNKKTNTNKINLGLVIIQFIITIACIVVGLIYLFASKNLLIVLEILVGLDLIIMGINNYLLHENKLSMIFYILFGIAMFVTVVFTALGVI